MKSEERGGNENDGGGSGGQGRGNDERVVGIQGRRTGIWKGTKLREARGRQGRVGAGPEK